MVPTNYHVTQAEVEWGSDHYKWERENLERQMYLYYQANGHAKLTTAIKSYKSFNLESKNGQTRILMLRASKNADPSEDEGDNRHVQGSGHKAPWSRLKVITPKKLSIRII